MNSRKLNNLKVRAPLMQWALERVPEADTVKMLALLGLRVRGLDLNGFPYVESGRRATRSAQCERDRRTAGTTGPARAPPSSLTGNQPIEDDPRALTRILCVAVERRHHAPALDINIGTRY